MACVLAKIKRNLNNMKCYYRCLWFQRKSRNNLRNPSLEAENLTWTTLRGASHILWKAFKLEFPLGRKKKKIVVLLPPIYLSASANLRSSWFSPCCFVLYLRPFYKPLTHWKESWSSLICEVASTHGLLPLVKHLAHELWQNTPEEEKVCYDSCALFMNPWNVCPFNIVQFEE